MRSVRLVVAVSAAMLVSAGVAVAPASSAEPSKGSGLHACAGKPITVVSGTKVDGKKVNAGTYSLTVEGMSCKRARQVIGLAIDRDAIIREVYELTTDRPGDGVALELVDDQGTDKAADDRRLRLVEAVGSTVNIVNAAERAFTVGVLRGSGTTGSVAPGQVLQVTGDDSSSSVDVSVAIFVGTGPLTPVPPRLEASSWPAGRRSVGVHNLQPACLFTSLEVGQQLVCPAPGATFTITRVDNDTTPRPGSSNRYQYDVTLNPL